MMAHLDLVAVIDDNRDIREMLQDALARFGFQAELFASAGEFLAAAPTCRASCVLLDVQLDDACGIDLARDLAGLGFRFPIIFMTASTCETIRRRAHDTGCAAFLQKPFALNELTQAIKTAITPKPDPSMII